MHYLMEQHAEGMSWHWMSFVQSGWNQQADVIIAFSAARNMLLIFALFSPLIFLYAWVSNQHLAVQPL